MDNKKLSRIVISLFTASLVVPLNANAATISARCSITGASRSSISVAVTGISGYYYIIVGSGVSGYKSPVKLLRPGVVTVYNFDSNLAAVPGATYISPSFIKNLRVDNYLRQSVTHRLDGAIAARCTAR